MSARHRVHRAIVRLAKEGQGASWAYETWSDGKTAYFAFESERSAQLVREALWLMFKTNRRQLIHKGRKPN